MRRGDDRDYLVVVAVDYQGGHVELLEIIGEVRLRVGLYALEGVLEAGLLALEPEGVTDTPGYFGARPVRSVEGSVGEVPVELRGVCGDAGAGLVEDLDRLAVGVRLGLKHERRHRAHEHGLGHPGGAVAANVAGHLPAARGVADQDGVSQV